MIMILNIKSQDINKQIIENIIKTLNLNLLESFEENSQDLQHKIAAIINFLEIKLQFHILYKDITYVVNKIPMGNKENIIVLPFWPIINITSIIYNENKILSKKSYKISENKLYLLPIDGVNNTSDKYTISYTIGYDWDKIYSALPIITYIIEYYLQQYQLLNKLETSEEMGKLLEEIKSQYKCEEIL